MRNILIGLILFVLVTRRVSCRYAESIENSLSSESSEIDSYEEDIDDIIDGIEADCADEFGLIEEEINGYRYGNVTNPRDELKCFTNCVLEATQIMKNGVFQYDILVGSIHGLSNETLLLKIIEDCKNEKGPNACETSYKITHCFAKYD